MGNIWLNLVLAVQLISAAAIIGLVLIQHGKGADMGASFGSGASGSLFGATGSANFLSRSTAVAASVFFVSTLVMAYYATTGLRQAPEGGTSVLERAGAASAPAAAPAAGTAIPPAASPGAAPGVAPAPATAPSATPASPAPTAPGIPSATAPAAIPPAAAPASGTK